ncbi:MAG: hypothetical protein FVQ80_11290 [Planctomycetes bacterium]|nr:hypothetical protein [Planctomycetota bacterium]
MKKLKKLLRQTKTGLHEYIVRGDELVKDNPDNYIVPDANQILIDIDGEGQYTLFNERLEILEEFYEFEYSVKPSSSGVPHRHVSVIFRCEFTVPEKLFLQSFLASDHMRDIMSFVQFQAGDKIPILLRKVTDG